MFFTLFPGLTAFAAVGFAAGWGFVVGSAGFFSLVIVLVETAALKYYTAAGTHEAHDMPLAFRAIVYRFIFHALKKVELVAALFTFVFVGWHSAPC
jgi:hypothetical protein